MRRDRKSKIRRERMIMIASSALVMGALTLTGVYVKNRSNENVDDGYSVDFSELENSVDDKIKEIEENKQVAEVPQIEDAPVTEDDLDYDPLAAGSALVQIPGLTDDDTLNDIRLPEDGAIAENIGDPEEKDRDADDDDEEDDEGADDDSNLSSGKADGKETADAKGTVGEAVTKNLNFSESQGLVRPVNGEVLMHYSMDASIYFATLDQYKYNPAVMLSANEGDVVNVCADGKVVSIFEDAKIGNAVTLDLGNGYQATYGQLKDIQVTEGSYVNRGEALASVAVPTKYFTTEGTNLYFQLTKDGEPVNPEGLFQ
ncbi:MAG: peptidoglycan DD-metalloendopeptidase family protein [Lachnospiraceae bacterium]|nr:peptidoglycan DD-metalloendopeptidase family protein [Lachnospiraceae bacterium]